MFAIPLATIIIVSSSSLLIVLNIKYSEAQPILLLLAIDALLLLIQQFNTFVIFGTEKLDEGATIPLRKLAGSNIFKIFTLPYLQAAISLPSTFIILTHLASGQPVLAAVYVTAVNLVARGIIVLIQYKMMLYLKKVTHCLPSLAFLGLGCFLIILSFRSNLIRSLPSSILASVIGKPTRMWGRIIFLLKLATLMRISSPLCVKETSPLPVKGKGRQDSRSSRLPPSG
jgi:hypothetical protein